MWTKPSLFDDTEQVGGTRRYRPVLTACVNHKGVLDVDTVKGCTFGMSQYPNGGCYGECYAYKIAHQYGIDFSTSVSRLMSHQTWRDVFCIVRDHSSNWYRIGTAGDPSHDWNNTISVCESMVETKKTPVIITKHWVTLTDGQIERLRVINATLNTSTSGLDTLLETEHRVRQMERLRLAGVRSINRVITCDFGSSEWAMARKERQDYLLSLGPIIDNPLRAYQSNQRVVNGDIRLTRIDEAIGGGKFVSLHSKSAYLGTCKGCPDQCGVLQTINPKEK
jgi:hypothetical protein